jgi:peroxiredoxin
MGNSSETSRAYLAGPSSSVLLPGLELQYPNGRPAALWDYRGKGPLVVILHDGLICSTCAAYLGDLARAHPHYRELGAQVLAIGRTAVSELPFPVLVDPDERLLHTLAASGVLPRDAGHAVLLVGRTGVIWAAWSADYAALPDPSELESWLEYILSECRECFCCELAWPEDWVRGEAHA